VNLGVQYYRAPFPEEKYWAADFAKIRESGLNTVQLWVLWAWVEPKPGEFCWDDYDHLMDLAAENDLGVILSTIAEIQPYWIHREVPGSEMVDHMGNKVVSSNRCECHFGLTPGGCTDHPGVWERMQGFLREVTKRYCHAPALTGWDAWNELRWNVNSDGIVCYCPHTLEAFRSWLSERFGGRDGLNAVWKRRYGQWDEVLPGKLPDRPYTEMMAFEHFITCRANTHARNRYDLMRAIDREHPITVHGGSPSPLYSGGRHDHPINRGNDWAFADHLDGVGCSSFPKWFGIDDADFGMRVEFVKSAARGKRVWLSEVQGGRASTGFNVYPSVDAPPQQRWIWNGIACGAETILFWCWRDEVFGRESSGFGLSGTDGLADERLDAMRRTGALLSEHADLIGTYRPLPAEVGVLFSPQAYYLHWAQDGRAGTAEAALTGYCRALVRSSIPYMVVEEEHLDVLDSLKVLFLPRTIVTDEATEKALEGWVNAGGTLVCESECGAFNSQGLYRYEADRFTARLTGCPEIGRRMPAGDTMQVALGGRAFEVPVAQWLTPRACGRGDAMAEHPDGALALGAQVGNGRIIMLGSYLGDAYRARPSRDTELLIEQIVRGAGWEPLVEVISPQPTADSFVYVKAGESCGRKLIFVFFPEDAPEVVLRFADGFLAGDRLTDIITGVDVAAPAGECTVNRSDWGIAVLVEA
jgi:beta-galactosidase